jgi:hypothetical protein
MPVSNQQYQRAGSFVPTTQVWNASQLQQVNVNSQDFKNLLVRLYQNLNQMAIVLNTKSTGAYYEQEFVTGDLFFPNPNNTLSAVAPIAPVQPVERQVSRAVVNFGALPDSTLKSMPHQLQVGPQWSFVKIYACATNPTLITTSSPNQAFLPIPYVDASGVIANNIELYVDQTNVNILTAADYSAWTTTYVVVEFITT